MELKKVPVREQDPKARAKKLLKEV
jgi:hypothetical protein